MTERAQIEQRIREVLATETQAIPLSDKLFQPDGLFGRLAGTEDERRAVAQSPLFRQAQHRLSELQRREAAEFARAVPPAQAAVSEGSFRLKLERAERA